MAEKAAADGHPITMADIPSPGYATRPAAPDDKAGVMDDPTQNPAIEFVDRLLKDWADEQLVDAQNAPTEDSYTAVVEEVEYRQAEWLRLRSGLDGSGACKVTIAGIWHNNDTTGVDLWCDTCGVWIGEGYVEADPEGSGNESLTVARAMAAVAHHRAREATSGA